jgi:protein ImuB
MNHPPLWLALAVPALQPFDAGSVDLHAGDRQAGAMRSGLGRAGRAHPGVRREGGAGVQLASDGSSPPVWLGACALQVTPRVARLDEVWCLDVGHTLRLWGGLPGVLTRLQAEVLGSAGLQTAAGCVPELAQGPTARAALARWRAGQRVPLWHTTTNMPFAPPALGAPALPGVSQPPHVPPATDLAQLPLHTLSAARPHAAVLARLGARTWGDLRRLPRDGVARRWGAALLTALDQALGLRPEAHEWVALPTDFDQTLELSHALDSAPALLPHAQRLLEALMAWLRARQRGVLALRWQWAHDARRDVSPTGGFELRTAQPTQALEHLLRLTAEHLARQPLAAPVLTLRLVTLVHSPWTPAEADCWQAPTPFGPQPLPWTRLLERLSARLGTDALTQWQPHNDHRAEHMQQPAPEGQKGLQDPLYTRQPHARRTTAITGMPNGLVATGSDGGNESEGESASLWPTWLLTPPQPLAVRDHRPCYQGELQLLAGPQRLELTQWPGAGVPQPFAAPGTAEASRGVGTSGKAAENGAAGTASRTDTPWRAGAAVSVASVEGAAGIPGDDRATVRDYFVARSPQAGLLWVYRVPPGERWFLHGLYA